MKKSCVASAVQSGAPKAVAKKYCACTAKYINDNMTTAEFIELERKEMEQPGSFMKNSVMKSVEPYCLDKISWKILNNSSLRATQERPNNFSQLQKIFKTLN